MDWSPDFLLAHRFAAAFVLDAGAQALKEAAEEVFRTQGGSKPWPDNSPITEAWKGPGKAVMEGRSGTLADSIEVRSTDPSGPGFNIPFQRLIGFFDQPHPDSETGMSVAEVAMAHEFGLEHEENIPGHGTGGSRPGLGMLGVDIPMDIPPRPWLSRASDDKGQIVLGRMEVIYSAIIRTALGRPLP